MPRFAVIVPAAGKSTRFKDREKKPFATLDGRAVWIRSAELFIPRNDVCQFILVIAPEDREKFLRRFTANLAFMNITLAEGGATRTDSVANALNKVRDEADYVAIHDAVRPCITADQIDAVFQAAQQHGAAILAVPVSDTLKRADTNRRIQATIPRQGLWLAQTPQVFRKDWLLAAYRKRDQLSDEITDDAQLVESAGYPVYVVEGTPTNIKITTKSDLILAEAILKSLPKPKVPGPLHPFADEMQWR
ncbi:MAG: 2-C-methyl-D-erythritol 4-phosphate cytidylyltransferase [Gemmatales bacterium]|nr:2-C-methyl-D-erythritol 4-phosphate cytidylyltransferase [Gemmatales bacterium]MCS7160594.1 2-C-methyl-D-erythritol 4-phosphate cytidylyltransferase [Gemmatales bacterium]MDW8175795.1 2-C-methyl-D-erythritol 4-phosphate cytidylyltransferase [Gemmatales bacterium]MDW8223779.1 2-C-methyl-D-erythritol 4-phosphate cytidylyltransferase [Gemmatales bacterium]